MYLHIGGDVMIPIKDIIVIVDYENVDRSTITDEFVTLADVDGILEKPEQEINAKSFIITNNKVYLSSISSSTLYKRASTKASFGDIFLSNAVE